MSASRFRNVGFGAHLVNLVAFVMLSTVVAVSSPPAQSAAAQETSAVSARLTLSTTRAKLDEVVIYTLHVENIGTATIPALAVSLNVADAFDVRGTHCQGDTHGATDACVLGDFPPGAITDVQFYVEVRVKEDYAGVAAYVTSSDTTVAFILNTALKIVGPNRR